MGVKEGGGFWLRENGLTLVPPTNMPPRAPFGPSDAFIAGMFFSGIAFVLQKSAAVRRDTFGLRQKLLGTNIVHSTRMLGGWHTFSCRVNRASFFRAEILVSLRIWDFCWGLQGGENSVLGVELVISLPTGDMLDSTSWSSERLLSGPPMVKDRRTRWD